VKTPSRLSRLPLPRRPLEWGLATVAVALVAIAITSLGAGSSSSSAATRRTATVGKGVVQSTVSGNGTLEPAQKVELSFGASGEVTAIDVKSGEKVKKGQVLAEVDSSSARASLASAEAQLIEAEEAVETAEEAEAEEAETEEATYTGGATMVLVDLTSEATASAVTEGAAPVEGDAAPTSTEADAAEELEAAKAEAAKLAKEKKELEKRAKEEAAKAKAAKESAGTNGAGGGSTENAPSGSTTGSSTESAGAATTAANGGESTSSGGGESTSGAATSGASVSLPTAEANLREAELSVESARQEVRETTLRAPISGTIASIAGAVGEAVSGGAAGGGTSEASAGAATGGESTGSGSAFMVIAQLHRLKMEVSFSESDIGKVRKGQTATVAIDSMEGTELSGEVTKVSVLPSEGSSSVVEYPATILLSQSAKGLRAGMSASAEVVVEQVKNAITVASEALSGKSVTIEEGGKEVTKAVTTGLEGDETTQIVSGLAVGDTVVLPEVTVATASGSEGESATSSKEGFAGLRAAAAAGGFTGGPPSGGGFPGAP
jgi:multidrug efflux pump subunit AcrA (membrane-fusion protein)